MKTIVRPCWFWFGFKEFEAELNALYKQGYVLHGEVQDKTGLVGLRHILIATVLPPPK